MGFMMLWARIIARSARFSISACLAGLERLRQTRKSNHGHGSRFHGGQQLFPAIIHVPVGGSIVFINAGRNEHNAIAVDKSWSSEKPSAQDEAGGHERDRALPEASILLLQFHATPDGKAGMVRRGGRQCRIRRRNSRRAARGRQATGVTRRAAGLSHDSERRGRGESRRPGADRQGRILRVGIRHHP
jgi:plastocyanin